MGAQSAFLCAPSTSVSLRCSSTVTCKLPPLPRAHHCFGTLQSLFEAHRTPAKALRISATMLTALRRTSRIVSSSCRSQGRSMATLGSFTVPDMKNEPFLHYPPGSAERVALRESVERMYNECPDIPCIVGGQEVRTGNVQTQVMPTEHGHAVCTFHEADRETMLAAAEAAKAAQKDWAAMPIEGARCLLVVLSHKLFCPRGGVVSQRVRHVPRRVLMPAPPPPPPLVCTCVPQTAWPSS